MDFSHHNYGQLLYDVIISKNKYRSAMKLRTIPKGSVEQINKWLSNTQRKRSDRCVNGVCLRRLSSQSKYTSFPPSIWSRNQLAIVNRLNDVNWRNYILTVDIDHLRSTLGSHFYILLGLAYTLVEHFYTFVDHVNTSVDHVYTLLGNLPTKLSKYISTFCKTQFLFFKSVMIAKW